MSRHFPFQQQLPSHRLPLGAATLLIRPGEPCYSRLISPICKNDNSQENPAFSRAKLTFHANWGRCAPKFFSKRRKAAPNRSPAKRTVCVRIYGRPFHCGPEIETTPFASSDHQINAHKSAIQGRLTARNPDLTKAEKPCRMLALRAEDKGWRPLLYID